MTTLRYAHVISRFVDRPLLLLPRHAVAMWNALSGRLGTAPMDDLPDDDFATQIDMRFDRVAQPRASRFAGEPATDSSGRRREPYMRMGDVGILSVVGELVNRGAWVGANSSGMVSYEGLKFQLARMAADPKIKKVLLELDSPGGEAIGSFEAAQAVRDLNDEKPVVAVVNGMSASAAYMLASGARRIYTTESGISGSIGVVMLHADVSRALDRRGITPTLIYAGAHKVDGNPFEPLPDDVRTDLQAEVDQIYAGFVHQVALGRGNKLSVDGARRTEARTFMGKQAVKAGLADGVATFDEVLSALAAKAPRKLQSIQTAAAVTSGSNAMARRPIDLQLGDDEPDDDTPAATAPAAPAQVATRFELNGQQFASLAAVAQHGREQLTGRIQTILADPRARGRERFAISLACDAPDLSAERVLELTEIGATALPASSVAPIASRIEPNLALVSSAPSAGADIAASPANPLQSAVERVNARKGRK